MSLREPSGPDPEGVVADAAVLRFLTRSESRRLHDDVVLADGDIVDIPVECPLEAILQVESLSNESSRKRLWEAGMLESPMRSLIAYDH